MRNKKPKDQMGMLGDVNEEEVNCLFELNNRYVGAFVYCVHASALMFLYENLTLC